MSGAGEEPSRAAGASTPAAPPGPHGGHGHELAWATSLVRTFIDSKLMPLIILFSVLLGAFAVLSLPREEEPQIKVPIIDIFVSMEGASPEEVEQRVTKPMEKLLWEIPGVESLYSTSSSSLSFMVARFEVGHDEEDAIVKVNQKMAMHFDLIPPGAGKPLIKPRSIDDVPVLALTLWSPRRDAGELRRLASDLADAIKAAPGVSETVLIGGPRREVRVTIEPAALAARGIAPLDVAEALRLANARSHSGALERAGGEVIVESGSLLRDAADVERVVVRQAGGAPSSSETWRR